MTLQEARLIREIKKRSTYRYLASIYYSKDEPGHGNQGFGQELCLEALRTLYPNEESYDPMDLEEKFGQTFVKDNLSKIGDFYWWE